MSTSSFDTTSIDFDGLELLGAVDDDADHAAAGAGLDAELGHLFLEALLHLLRLLHHLLDIHFLPGGLRPPAPLTRSTSLRCL